MASLSYATPANTGGGGDMSNLQAQKSKIGVEREFRPASTMEEDGMGEEHGFVSTDPMAPDGRNDKDENTATNAGDASHISHRCPIGLLTEVDDQEKLDQAPLVESSDETRQSTCHSPTNETSSPIGLSQINQDQDEYINGNPDGEVCSQPEGVINMNEYEMVVPSVTKYVSMNKDTSFEDEAAINPREPDILPEKFPDSQGGTAEDAASYQESGGSKTIIHQDLSSAMVTVNTILEEKRQVGDGALLSCLPSGGCPQEVQHTTSLPGAPMTLEQKQLLQLPNVSIHSPITGSYGSEAVFSKLGQENLPPGINGSTVPSQSSLPSISTFVHDQSPNMVYAAVPLQQMADGMQLNPLPSNALPCPNGSSRGILMPRSTSTVCGDNTTSNSFKGKVAPLSYDRPNVGLVSQIIEVFRATGKEEMQPFEVYDALECCYPYYLHMNPSRKKSWMSSVRHALTTPFFKSRRSESTNTAKLTTPRKGSFWSINKGYDPDVREQKEGMAGRRPRNTSPRYSQKRSLGIPRQQQANWEPIPGPRKTQQHRQARAAPYNYFSPTRGSFSPADSVAYSPTSAYQSQPTAALLPNGKMIYLSPASTDDSANVTHPRQGSNRNDFYHAWGTNDSTSSSPSLWQVVQNSRNNSNQAGDFFTGDQQQGRLRYSLESSPTNNNTNSNNTVPQVLPNAAGLDQVKHQHLLQQQRQQLLQQQQQLLQQQQQQIIQHQQQQHHHQQQQLDHERQPSPAADPVATALELSEIKTAKGTSRDAGTHHQTAASYNWKQESKMGQSQDAAATANSSRTLQPIAVEMACSPDHQLMLIGEPQHSAAEQQLAQQGVCAQSQEGCDDLRTMIYHSLGVTNDLGTRPAAGSQHLANVPANNQFSAVPSTQYQLVQYSGANQQFESIGSISI